MLTEFSKRILGGHLGVTETRDVRDFESEGWDVFTRGGTHFFPFLVMVFSQNAFL
jgi:hypothetical protein